VSISYHIFFVLIVFVSYVCFGIGRSLGRKESKEIVEIEIIPEKRITAIRKKL
jgi:hypothetical protein